MKFISLPAVFLLFCCSVQSQVQFSLFAGPQTTTASYTVQAVKQKTTSKYGGIIGLGLKVPFENRLYFAPSVFYSMKGYKAVYNRFAYPPDTLATDNNTTFHTVETAFLLQYDFSSQPNHFLVKFGPSLDFHLLGKEKFNTATGLVSRNTPFGFDKYGHYSANFLLHFGYEMKSDFFILGQYTHGIASINNADGGPRIRHRAFGIAIGKYLGRNKIILDTRTKE